MGKVQEAAAQHPSTSPLRVTSNKLLVLQDNFSIKV